MYGKNDHGHEKEICENDHGEEDIDDNYDHEKDIVENDDDVDIGVDG